MDPKIEKLTRWIFQRMTGLTDEEMISRYDAEDNSDLAQEVQDTLHELQIM